MHHIYYIALYVETLYISWKSETEALVKYQDPANADQIMRIQRNLDETRDVLTNTIETVLQRIEFAVEAVL